MRTTTISAIMVLALVQIASAAQTLTMNGEEVDEVTLKTGQICLVHIVSDNSNPYSAYVGFDDRVVLGTFGPTSVYPEAGDLASITEYDVPAFYVYFASAAGTSPPPSPGNHFGITYQPQQVGETELKLYDSLRMTVIAKVHITVVSAQMGTVFTYQGRLLEAGDPADGQYDFEFKLYNAPSYGSQLAGTIEANDLDVINGYFTKELDFGSDVFNGDACWLDISVRPGGSSSSFTPLGPRQRITSTPYSLQTRGIFVDNAGNVGMGTTSPGQELHVYQPVRNVYVRAESDGGYAFFQADGTDNSGLRLEEDGTLKANVYWNTASQCLSLAYGNDDSLVVKGENVGIGTENPTRNLHIYRDSGPAQIGIVTADTSTKAQIIFGDGSGNKWTISSDNTDENKLHFRSGHASGTPRVTFQQDGKVGIGTTNPEADLHVEGETTMRGSLWIRDTLYVPGPYIGTFPRPAYDSGWFAVPPGQDKILNHNLGGNVDDYVVDMQFKDYDFYGINNANFGGDNWDTHVDGAFWKNLTTTSIKVYNCQDSAIEDFHIRIWVYN